MTFSNFIKYTHVNKIHNTTIVSLYIMYLLCIIMITLQLTSLETGDILLTLTWGDSITINSILDFSISRTLN